MIIVLFCLASWLTYVFVAGVLAFGLCVYYLLDIARRRKWCEFRPQTYCKITNLGDAINNIGGEDAPPGHETPCTMSMASDRNMTSEDAFMANDDGIMS